MHYSIKPDFQGSAVRFLLRNGTQASYNIVSNGAYNPDTMQIEQTPSATNILVFPFKASKEELSSPNLVGLDIKAFRIAGNALLVTPKAEDYISLQGQVYTVLKVFEAWDNDGTISYYTILTSFG